MVLHLIEERLGQWGEVVSGGLVDTYEAARGAGDRLASAQVDILFIYAATYATSSIVLPVVQATKAPVVVLNLQPIPALDYEAMTTEEWLANCSACCVPEIGGALTRARIAYKVISGALLEDERAWGEIEAWCRAAGAAYAVRHARFGFLAACRRERSSSHASRSARVCIAHSAGKSTRTERGRRQNRVSDGA